MSEPGRTARLGVDIGGTFTDVALEAGGRRWTAKILTTSAAPERGVLEAMQAVLAAANIAPAQVALVIHGTTLATNALIERKGAKTALVTTEGFRDTIEIRHENRFEQYDVNIDLPPPLVPRRLRFPVRGPSRSASCTASPTRRMSAGSVRCWPSACRTLRSRSPATCRRRCANTSASPPPAPTPMSSR